MAKRKAGPKRKASKRKPREIVPEPLNAFQAYGNALPRSLTHEIRSEIDGGNRELEELVNAIHALDQFGDKKPLVELFTSQGTTTAKLIADMIDRYIPKRDRRRQPIYVLRADHHIMLNAVAEVRELQASGMSRADAITQVTEGHNIDINKMVEWVAGRARPMRKQKACAQAVFVKRA
jgi:hypothetical protein